MGSALNVSYYRGGEKAADRLDDSEGGRSIDLALTVPHAAEGLDGFEALPGLAAAILEHLHPDDRAEFKRYLDLERDAFSLALAECIAGLYSYLNPKKLVAVISVPFHRGVLDGNRLFFSRDTFGDPNALRNIWNPSQEHGRLFDALESIHMQMRSELVEVLQGIDLSLDVHTMAPRSGAGNAVSGVKAQMEIPGRLKAYVDWFAHAFEERSNGVFRADASGKVLVNERFANFLKYHLSCVLRAEVRFDDPYNLGFKDLLTKRVLAGAQKGGAAVDLRKDELSAVERPIGGIYLERHLDVKKLLIVASAFVAAIQDYKKSQSPIVALPPPQGFEQSDGGVWVPS